MSLTIFTEGQGVTEEMSDLLGNWCKVVSDSDIEF